MASSSSLTEEVGYSSELSASSPIVQQHISFANLTPTVLPVVVNLPPVTEELITPVVINSQMTDTLLPLPPLLPVPVLHTVSIPKIRKYIQGPSHVIKTLNRDSSQEDVRQVLSNIDSSFHKYQFSETIEASYEEAFRLKLRSLYKTDSEKRNWCNDWKNWNEEDFKIHLRLVFPDLKHSSDKSFLECIDEIDFKFDLDVRDTCEEFLFDITRVLKHFPNRSDTEELAAVKSLYTQLKSVKSINWRALMDRVAMSCCDMAIISTVEDWHFVWNETLIYCEKQRALTESLGYLVSGTFKTKHLDSTKTKKSHPQPSNSTSSTSTTPSAKSLLLCTGCGRNGHVVKSCNYTFSRYYNGSTHPYIGCTKHNNLVQDLGPRAYIPNKEEMKLILSKKRELPSSSSSASSSSSSSSTPKPANKKAKGTLYAHLLSSITTKSNFIFTSLTPLFNTQVASTSQRLEIKTLLDTGNLVDDCVALKVVDSLNLTPYIVRSNSKTVCSGLDNKCYDVSNTIALSVRYFNEILNNYDVFDINAIILENSPIDLLICRDTIIKFGLFTNIPSQLKGLEPITGCLTAPENVCITCDCQPKGESRTPESIPKGFNIQTPGVTPIIIPKRGILASLVLQSEQLLGIPIPDEDEIDHDKHDVFSPWIPKSNDTSPLSLINIDSKGDEDLQHKIRTLCTEFSDIFSNELPVEPANVPPFNLIVDTEKWKVPRNRGPPRSQSTSKQSELVKTLNTLKSQGIIENSQATHYSQVLMVPKPDGSSRMCIDYRALNDCTPDASWPIPNIAEMLRRIGAQKPKIFGVMDLTQGYHQAPLTLAARVFTAFITFSGIYQFTRLPFGPKRAPSYFQETMASIVLAGLIYHICEMYIDDCNVFATTTDEFITRLRQIFMRFRKHNLYIKAAKCYFGYKELDFVGKVVSEEGLKMSRTKIQSVLDFPVPTVGKQLKSFLGTVNYFRDFIRNLSSMVKPLHVLITDYSKTRKLIWNPEAIAAFEEVKLQISKCTTMHFLSDTAPITMHTDASDYGVGGYLFQTVDGKNQPVAFVSKSLSKAQLRWSVIQKEAYGIYFSITYLQTLLRDRQFTIRTDHKNLLFIRENSNPMIVRWYMALMEFDFKIEFIAGSDNDIADSMSRLCRNNMIDSPREYSEEHIYSSSIIEKFRLSPLVYKKIGKMHNSIVGHFGLERTLKRFKDTKDVWQFQRQHIRYFIDHCPCCQKMSMLKIPIHAHHFTTSTYTPMECLNIDFIGPFPDGGHILVIVCTFTRWVELYVTTDCTALSAAECLLQHFGRFGAPHQLRSDNGPHFIADLIREFLALIGVEHCLTLAYSKEENSIVERYNKEINRHLRALTFDNLSLTNYKKSVPFVQRILNSNHSDRLKISAAQLLFGNVLKLDRGIFLPVSERQTSTSPLSKYTSDLLLMQDNLLKASAAELLRTDLLHMTSKEQNTHKEFPTDSFVLVHYRTGLPPTRLHTFWHGPMRVIRGANSRYTLLDLITGKEKDYHVSDIKPFIFDPALIDPIDVARRDRMEFFIEKILEHRGNLKRRSEIEFLVRWLGYDEQHDSWEPYANLRDSTQLHAYLLEKNLKRLIPSKFH